MAEWQCKRSKKLLCLGGEGCDFAVCLLVGFKLFWSLSIHFTQELSALHTTQPYSAEVMCSLEHPCFVGQKILYLRTTVQKCAIRCVLEDLAPLNCVSGVWTPAL